MRSFEDTYDARKKEIKKLLSFMMFIEEMEFDENGGKTQFDKVFHNEVKSVNISYQELINILKSNISLMLYSIIEFTVTNLIDDIYSEISNSRLSYNDVNNDIRKKWRETILKSANDPNANFNTFINKNEEIINYIIDNKTLNLKARSTLPAGNLDGTKIIKTFAAHGLKISPSSVNYRPDILETIKKQRNNLSHGSVSFIEAVRSNTLSDINENKKFIFSFLDKLIDNVDLYIENKLYEVKSEER